MEFSGFSGQRIASAFCGGSDAKVQAPDPGESPLGLPIHQGALLAHEAGHAKQEERYGQSCYTAGNVQFSKFDWFRTFSDVAGAALEGPRAGGTRGAAGGSAEALAVAHKSRRVRTMPMRGVFTSSVTPAVCGVAITVSNASNG